jgi:hypothetical protein
MKEKLTLFEDLPDAWRVQGFDLPDKASVGAVAQCDPVFVADRQKRTV